MQPRSKIVLLLSTFPRPSETFIVNKFLQLLASGWDVHVVCSKYNHRDWSYFPQSTDHSAALRRIHPIWPLSPRWLALSLIPAAVLSALVYRPRACLRYLLRGRVRFGWRVFWQLYQDYPLVLLEPDLLHIEFGAIAAQRTYLKELLDCKLIVSFRGYDLYCAELDNPNYYREVWESSDALHFLGESLWRQAQIRGCPQEKYHALIPPAIDPDIFNPGMASPPSLDSQVTRPLRILSVGRLEWKKGYEYSLQAIRLLVERGIACEYRIIGDGEFMEALSFARRQLNLEEKVTFLGALDQIAVKEQMKWADVFLHGAVTEGFCNAVIEAQAMQLPVVCTDAGGLIENIVDGETGFVVPRRDPLALADKMALLVDPSLRQQMGKAGRERVLNRFRIQEQISKFSDLYHQVLSQ